MKNLRRAKFDDLELLFELRNDPEAVKYSLNQRLVTKDEHERWFRSKLAQNEDFLFIYENDGIKMGMGRADLKEGQYELSWNVSAKHRGSGIGLQIVKELIEKFKPSIAKIKHENIPSLRIVEKLQFKEKEKLSDHSIYQFGE